MAVPDLLTVEEAARVLRIGRSAAYELAGRFLASDGRDGIPAIRVGRLLRVPRAALEQLMGTPISDIPATTARASTREAAADQEHPSPPRGQRRTSAPPRLTMLTASPLFSDVRDEQALASPSGRPTPRWSCRGSCLGRDDADHHETEGRRVSDHLGRPRVGGLLHGRRRSARCVARGMGRPARPGRRRGSGRSPGAWSTGAIQSRVWTCLAGHRERKVRAIDVTLSVPKSVSMLWAFGSPETSAAVSRAVVEATDTALGFLEERAAVARVQEGGIRRRVGTDGFAIATFAHRTSRAGDPQLHTHCLIPNIVRRADGCSCGVRRQPVARVGQSHRHGVPQPTATHPHPDAGGGVGTGTQRVPGDDRLQPGSAPGVLQTDPGHRDPPRSHRGAGLRLQQGPDAGRRPGIKAHPATQRPHHHRRSAPRPMGRRSRHRQPSSRPSRR